MTDIPLDLKELALQRLAQKLEDVRRRMERIRELLETLPSGTRVLDPKEDSEPIVKEEPITVEMQYQEGTA